MNLAEAKQFLNKNGYKVLKEDFYDEWIHSSAYRNIMDYWYDQCIKKLKTKYNDKIVSAIIDFNDKYGGYADCFNIDMEELIDNGVNTWVTDWAESLTDEEYNEYFPEEKNL